MAAVAPPEQVNAALARKFMRRQTLQATVVGAILMILSIGVGASALNSSAAETASKNSVNSLEISLANNERNACITERRNAQADAAGRISIHANSAEIAGLVEDNDVELMKNLALYAEAVVDWHKATDSLSPENLNAEPPLGCGPPVTKENAPTTTIPE